MKEIFSTIPSKVGDTKWNDAKQICYERHLDEFPEDIEYEPKDSEIEEEINETNEWTWEGGVEDDLKDFFNNGQTYVLRGYLDLWNGRKSVGAIIHNYKELTEAWSTGSIECFGLFDDRGKFCIDSVHHDGTNKYMVKRLTKKGLNILKKEYYNLEQKPIDFFTKLWEKENSCELNFYNKHYK